MIKSECSEILWNVNQLHLYETVFNILEEAIYFELFDVKIISYNLNLALKVYKELVLQNDEEIIANVCSAKQSIIELTELIYKVYIESGQGSVIPDLFNIIKVF